MFKILFDWYEQNKTLNIGIAAGLFLIQIVHLIWLLGEVVWFKLFGYPLFSLEGVWQWIIIFVDYTEIPALISVSFVYLNELRKAFNWKDMMLFLFANSQWLHLLWITDEFVLESFSGATLLPVWLAWIAILIDYLELPVIYDTIRKFFLSLKEDRVKDFLATELRD